MNKLILVMMVPIHFFTSSQEKVCKIEKIDIQEINTPNTFLFYKNLIVSYFVSLPNRILIHFSFEGTKDVGTISIDKISKKISIDSNNFRIYNQNNEFFFKDKELDETNRIQKPEIVDLFFNDNISEILKNATLYIRNNRLSCKIEINDSIGSSTLILSFNIITMLDKKSLELKFWNIKNEYMKNRTIKIIKIEKN